MEMRVICEAGRKINTFVLQCMAGCLANALMYTNHTSLFPENKAITARGYVATPQSKCSTLKSYIWATDTVMIL